MSLQKIKDWSGFSAVIFAGLLALTLIVAIWSEFTHVLVWKLAGTQFVLFFLSALTHAILQGLIPKNETE